MANKKYPLTGLKNMPAKYQYEYKYPISDTCKAGKQTYVHSIRYSTFISTFIMEWNIEYLVDVNNTTTNSISDLL
jgi:hypothetical protein